MDKATSQLSLPEAPREFGSFVDGAYVPAGDRKILRAISTDAQNIAITGHFPYGQADIEFGKRECRIK